MLCVKQGSMKYHFWLFGMTWNGIEPPFAAPEANTLNQFSRYDAQPQKTKIFLYFEIQNSELKPFIQLNYLQCKNFLCVTIICMKY